VIDKKIMGGAQGAWKDCKEASATEPTCFYAYGFEPKHVKLLITNLHSIL